MSLAIRKTSWHYRLHVFIRSAWGWKPSPTERWSLCPYFHTTLWGSLLTLLAVPFALLGWVCCKALRTIYKVGAKGGPLGFVSTLIDATPIGGWLDEAADGYDAAPIIESLRWLLVVLGLAAGFAGVVGLIVFFLGGGLWLIPRIPGAVWTALLYFGWGLFEFFGILGWALIGIGDGLVIAAQSVWGWLGDFVNWLGRVFTDGDLWLNIGIAALRIVAALVGTAGGAVLLMVVLASKPARAIYAWAEIRANGYMDAREKRKNAPPKSGMSIGVAVAETAKDIADDVCKPRHKPRREGPSLLETILLGLKAFVLLIAGFFLVIWVAIKSLYAREGYKMEIIDGQPVKRRVEILGPLGVFIKFLVSLKKGACPLLEFVEDGDLSDDDGEATDPPAGQPSVA